MLEVAETEVGRARIAKVTERTDHSIIDRVAEGDQQTAQGGIGPCVEAPPMSRPSEDFVFIPIVKSVSDNERFTERVTEIRPVCQPNLRPTQLWLVTTVEIFRAKVTSELRTLRLVRLSTMVLRVVSWTLMWLRATLSRASL